MSEGKEYRLVVEVAEQIITSPPMLSVSIKFYLATVLEKPLDRSWESDGRPVVLWAKELSH
ncbi:hypothetical protein, partial [Escherichia coli]|uniref:hypothetical protein n=1 Tax=Escherichia coli TaxID=562 RepID=UPI0020013BCB